MIKGQAVRLYYQAFSLIDGTRVTGDASNHTVYYTDSDSWETLEVQPTELSDGVYTFVLPAAKTDTDTAVCMIKSSTDDVLVTVIELMFNDSQVSLDTGSINSIKSTISSIEVGSQTLGTALNNIYAGQADISNRLIAINSQLSELPDGSTIAQKSDIPSLASITQSVLTTDISNYSSPGAYSVTSMICGGFSSEMDPETGKWVIRRPTGPIIATRDFETDEDLKPITRVW